MACLNQMLYTIKDGDNLYNLANRYNTTVEEIMTANNYLLDPQNLIVGSQIMMCNNIGGNNANNGGMMSVETVQLLDQMNTLWEQHTMWTRMLLISIAENLRDLEPTKARLLQNPKDMGNLYRKYYGDRVGDKITDLFTEHLTIGGDIMNALKNGNTALAKTLDARWHKNADDIADFLSSINENTDRETMRKMLYNHLRLLTDEVNLRMKKDYAGDIKAHDKVEQEALKMAKYMGIEIASDKLS